jgi:hypothetical protein
LAREAAAIIRSWADEDPRALWERLRAEGPAVCPPVDAREVGRWIQRAVWSYEQGNVRTGFVGPGERRQDTTATATATATERDPRGLPSTIHDDARTLDPWGVLGLLDVSPVAPVPDCADTARRHPVPVSENTKGLNAGADGPHVVLGDLRARMALSPLVGAVQGLVCDVLGLGAPCEVVGPVIVSGAVKMAHNCPDGPGSVERRADKGAESSVDSAAGCAENEPPVSVFVSPSSQWPIRVGGPDLSGAADAVLGGFCDGSPFHGGLLCCSATIPYGGGHVNLRDVLVYMDGPYENTTGYANVFARNEQVATIRRWSDAGARCMVSEAEPIPELMADGWHAVEITAMRVGQKRTFSKQQSEWVTCNFEPDARARLVCERAIKIDAMRDKALIGGEQADLFGGAS